MVPVFTGEWYQFSPVLKEMPVLIIHGLNDPFIPVEHSKKMTTFIPDARTKWIENMGHDIPLNLNVTVCDEIITFLNLNRED